MKRVTTNEIKDIALFAVAYSMLQNDSETEGVFLNKATSDKLLELKDAMFHVLSKYNAENQYRVLNQIDRMHNAMVAKSTEFTITAVQLALSILTLWLPKNVYSSKQLLQLNFKRNMFIHNFIHQASAIVMKELISRKIETLIIGYNEDWKQNINLGKRINQQFVQIPYKTFIDKIMYKCEDYGIKVILTEESYTSKIDHLAGEKMQKHTKYKGKRIHRGLFLSSTGIVINADVNGALGIMRKVFSESAKQIVGSGVAFTPVIIQPINYTRAKAQCNCIRIENTKKAS